MSDRDEKRSVSPEPPSHANGAPERLCARDAKARERAQRQSGPWSTVMDVPPELQRSRPSPSEIEEKEVEVIVYTTSGRPL